MTVAPVYKQGWTMDDVHWELFDPSKVEPRLLSAIKAAALVEYNAPDYVTYLKRVFRDAGDTVLSDLERWGREESQHGRALGRWAEMADPDFNLETAFARFRADEYRHYKLFYDILGTQSDPDLGFWKKLAIAVGRVRESDDDELAFAYYCANVSSEREAITPYNRKKFSKAAGQASMAIYHRKHIQKLVQMVMKVLGADPHGWMANLAGSLLWRRLQSKAA